MNLFTNKSLQWVGWMNSVKNELSKRLSDYGNNYGPSSIFGQILTVLNSMTQTLMLYIEDAMTEQNIYTAERKKSIYGLARLTGYEPSLGTAASCSVKLTYSPTNIYNTVIIPDRTTLTSVNNGLSYIMMLSGDTLTINTSTNPFVNVNVVEGIFNTQSFTSTGGKLYSVNANFSGDVDLDYLSVTVNGEVFSKAESLYDMNPYEKSYVARVSLEKGIDIVFGNGQYGWVLSDGDSIEVEYLSHSGELGNLSSDDTNTFVFSSSITDAYGDSIDGNSVFSITLDNNYGVSSGSYSEDVSVTQEMIGYNSRSMVLADANNYKLLLSRYSFVGYNRCWSEAGAMTVNAMVIKNYTQLVDTGSDYFNLTENDFFLTDQQKDSIITAIDNSGSQYAGTIFNFIDPTLKKYAMYVYVKMKDNVSYVASDIKSQIRILVGNFFTDLYSDMYIPKSDIIYEIKNNISDVDGVDIYILSEDNETAKIQGYYDEVGYVYDKYTEQYSESSERIYISDPDESHIGLDEFGNILLDNDIHFPVLMGGWSYGSDDATITISDPLNITFV